MQISGLSNSYNASIGGSGGAPGGKGHMHLSKLAADQFSTIDTSGDGSITEDELKAALDQLAAADGTSGTGSVTDDQAEKLFKKIDTDGDGKISATEWSAFQQKVQSFQQQQQPPMAALASTQFSAVDTNGDGSISQDELSALLSQTSSANGTSATDDKAAKLFKKIDANGDGKISSSEWAAFQQKVATMQHHRQQASASAASAASADSTQSTSATAALQNMVSKLYQAADTNGDGQLTQQELTSFLQQAMGTTGVNTLT